MSHPPQVRPEEPIAVTPHDGICGGESQQWLSYPTNPHVRFDERGRETERAAWPQATAPSSNLSQIRGKKRHVLVDTHGLLLHAIVHAANIQDRDGGVLLMATLFGRHPFLLKLFADGGIRALVRLAGFGSRA